MFSCKALTFIEKRCFKQNSISNQLYFTFLFKNKNKTKTYWQTETSKKELQQLLESWESSLLQILMTFSLFSLSLKVSGVCSQQISAYMWSRFTRRQLGDNLTFWRHKKLQQGSHGWKLKLLKFRTEINVKCLR